MSRTAVTAAGAHTRGAMDKEALRPSDYLFPDYGLGPLRSLRTWAM